MPTDAPQLLRRERGEGGTYGGACFPVVGQHLRHCPLPPRVAVVELVGGQRGEEGLEVCSGGVEDGVERRARQCLIDVVEDVTVLLGGGDGLEVHVLGVLGAAGELGEGRGEREEEGTHGDDWGWD